MTVGQGLLALAIMAFALIGVACFLRPRPHQSLNHSFSERDPLLNGSRGVEWLNLNHHNSGVGHD